MATRTVELLIRILADEGQLRAALGGSTRQLGALGTAGTAATGRIDQGMARAALGTQSLAGQLQRAQRLLVGFFGFQIAGQSLAGITRLAEEYTNVNARLKLVTGGQEEFNAVQGELFAIAQRSRGALAETVDLYARLARSTKDLDDVAPSDLLRVTEAINQALIVSGGSADSAKAAIIQLGQGLASGQLAGEELRSVLEQAPRLAEAIATGLGIGIGQLREFAAEGKITTEEIIRAILSQSSTLQAEFDQMPTTVGQALTKIKNGWLDYIGQADQANGATRRLAGALGALGDNLGEVANAAVTVGGIVATVYAVRLAQSIRL